MFFYTICNSGICLFVEVQAISTEVKNQIDHFKPYIHMIQALRNPGMRQRHWDKLADETGYYVLEYIFIVVKLRTTLIL